MHADGSLDVYRFIQPSPSVKEAIPPRHRRKKRDDDSNSSVNGQAAQAQTKESANSRGVQFDLVEEAFPPLPGTMIILYPYHKHSVFIFFCLLLNLQGACINIRTFI